MKRILVIGGGSIGERHVRCFQQTGRADVALCETRDEVRTRVADAYHLNGSFASLDQALQTRFHAAVICTPAHLHVPIALQLLEQEIDLLIEKPLSASLEGLQPLLDLAHRQNAKVAVAYVYRHHPALFAMRHALQSGRFGAPVEVVMHSGQHFPFYRPAYRDTYYTDRATGGGAIQDALTHMVNAAEWLVGPVTRLVADAEHCVLEGVQVEDTAHLLTRHDQVLGSYSINQHQPVNETRLTVLCQRGALRFEAHRHRWLTSQQPDAPWQVQETFALERDDLFVRQAIGFLEFLAGKAEPACSLSEAAHSLRVNQAALTSLETAQWVTL